MAGTGPETSETSTPGGWLRLTDRSKEMIKVRGFQVAPAEVEAILHGHPAVADCAVFGIPDPAHGEAVIAAVTLDAIARPVDPAELHHAGRRQAGLLQAAEPGGGRGGDPRLPSGKVLRRVLKETYRTPVSQLSSRNCATRRPGWSATSGRIRCPDLADADRVARLEKAVAATGWRTLRSDGATGVEVALVAEEFGRRLVDVPFLGPVLADDLRRSRGDLRRRG